MADWVLWCGCSLPSASVTALPDTYRMREEPCALCGSVIPPHARVHRIPRVVAQTRRRSAGSPTLVR